MDTVAVTYSDLHVSTASTEVVSNKTGPFPVDQLHPHLSETVKISLLVVELVVVIVILGFTGIGEILILDIIYEIDFF